MRRADILADARGCSRKADGIAVVTWNGHPHDAVKAGVLGILSRSASGKLDEFIGFFSIVDFGDIVVGGGDIEGES